MVALAAAGVIACLAIGPWLMLYCAGRAADARGGGAVLRWSTMALVGPFALAMLGGWLASWIALR